jgi:hypothetical protein
MQATVPTVAMMRPNNLLRIKSNPFGLFCPVEHGRRRSCDWVRVQNRGGGLTICFNRVKDNLLPTCE